MGTYLSDGILYQVGMHGLFNFEHLQMSLAHRTFALDK